MCWWCTCVQETFCEKLLLHDSRRFLVIWYSHLHNMCTQVQVVPRCNGSSFAEHYVGCHSEECCKAKRVSHMRSGDHSGFPLPTLTRNATLRTTLSIGKVYMYIVCSFGASENGLYQMYVFIEIHAVHSIYHPYFDTQVASHLAAFIFSHTACKHASFPTRAGSVMYVGDNYNRSCIVAYLYTQLYLQSI